MKKLFVSLIATLICASNPVSSLAKGAQFDLLKATPVGSWQVRKDIETNHKGKNSGSTVRTSLLSSELRDGETYYWVEMVMQPFKADKQGEPQASGDQVVIKSLVPATLMQSEPGNVMGNLRGFGKETIIQNGQEDPMRISNSGGLMAGLMKTMGIEIKYNFEDVGADQIAVAAGEFATTKFQGAGSTEGKILFKKFKIDSDNTVWISPEVPFGTVKIDGININNGKQSTYKSELIEFGLSGASSLITKQPKDMPTIPNIFGN